MKGMDRGRIPAFLWLRAEDVVEMSLAGLARGKLFVVTGGVYKAIVILERLMPALPADRVIDMVRPHAEAWRTGAIGADGRRARFCGHAIPGRRRASCSVDDTPRIWRVPEQEIGVMTEDVKEKAQAAAVAGVGAGVGGAGGASVGVLELAAQGVATGFLAGVVIGVGAAAGAGIAYGIYRLLKKRKARSDPQCRPASERRERQPPDWAPERSSSRWDRRFRLSTRAKL